MSIDNGEEVRVVSATGGEKGSKDAQLGAVDPLALLELAKVAGFGAKKYDNFNYLRGYDWLLSINAGERHGLQFAAGEDLDPESGLCHAAHAAWNYLALTSFYLRGLGTDNRVSAFLADQNSPSTLVMTVDFDVPVKADGWLEDDGSVTPIDWSNPAPDFWYYDYSDYMNEYNLFGEQNVFDLDDEFVEGTQDPENPDDSGLYHILNPEIFGEFKPVEAKSPVLIDFGGTEEKPFKVGDRVNVHGYTLPGKVSNIDWHANQLRVEFDVQPEYVKWVNTNQCTKVS
jgi:hypothetical protein